MEETKVPRVTAAVYIFNKDGKVFLMRGPKKFSHQYFIPGGHVDWGEKIADCAQREVKEETGLDIYDLQFFRTVEFVFDPVYSADKHFVSSNFIAKTNAPEDAVVLDTKESEEYAWLTPEEIVKRDDVERVTKEGMVAYIDREKNNTTVDYKLNWQRAIADYQNLQKEVAARRTELVMMSEQQILEEFIPVYDNFKKAFAFHPTLSDGDETHKKVQQWISGIGHIQRQFSDILKMHKVEEIKTVGQKFDPKFHESVGEESSDTVESGSIIREVDGGYVMGGRVIKVAKVIIAK